MKEVHSRFASAVGCYVAGSDFRLVADCLRRLPVEALLEQQHMFDQCNTIGASERKIVIPDSSLPYLTNAIIHSEYPLPLSLEASSRLWTRLRALLQFEDVTQGDAQGRKGDRRDDGHCFCISNSSSLVAAQIVKGVRIMMGTTKDEGYLRGGPLLANNDVQKMFR